MLELLKNVKLVYKNCVKSNHEKTQLTTVIYQKLKKCLQKQCELLDDTSLIVFH